MRGRTRTQVFWPQFRDSLNQRTHLGLYLLGNFSPKERPPLVFRTFCRWKGRKDDLHAWAGEPTESRVRIYSRLVLRESRLLWLFFFILFWNKCISTCSYKQQQERSHAPFTWFPLVVSSYKTPVPYHDQHVDVTTVKTQNFSVTTKGPHVALLYPYALFSNLPPIPP